MTCKQLASQQRLSLLRGVLRLGTLRWLKDQRINWEQKWSYKRIPNAEPINDQQPMISYLRTDSDNPDFQKLVIQLDAYLRILDGDDHLFYAQLNKTDSIKHVMVVYQNGEPVGWGAIRHYSADAVEVKRMYVLENQRGKGIASTILNELETWAKELTNKKCILETGKRQVEAVNLYQKAGYTIIENYGKYKTMENSVCFEKILRK